ncbi:MAG TPA: HAD family hydrolase [Candidatus Avelusimicrobium excrementipullorum]|nr:HAD family hydrolase [Candidatus Avelusimicrobium excrementipullorum]
MKNNIKFVAFDADDTLWVNENYFREAEHAFCHLMMDWLPHEKTADELFKTEMQNLELFGYGAKGFALSLIETAVRISDGKITGRQVQQIIDIVKRLLARPVELLPDVPEVLRTLKEKYTLVLATKGDLLDQQRKIAKSGLAGYFAHTEIMSDKRPQDYVRLLQRLGAGAQEFVMVGNSLKSDVLAPLEAGAYAVYVPYPIIWKHECTPEPQSPRYYKAEKLRDILRFLL